MKFNHNTSSSMIIPFRKHLSIGKWFIRRSIPVLQYHILLYQKAPIEEQLKFLPTPVFPLVFWTELKRIKLHASLCTSHSGRFCMDNDWDINLTYNLPSVFDDIPRDAKKWDVHETVRALFLFNKHYSTTPQYQAMVNAVKNKDTNPPQGCRTLKQVDQYFERLMAAFSSMQTEGYLTQEQLGKSSVGEIRVHITRNGELCLGGGGNHRIRMAEILDIKEVPFLIQSIHPQWVKTLCHLSNLPPHKAVMVWLTSEFNMAKSKHNSNSIFCEI